jgi:lipopolysaccharide export system protein LptA
LVTLNGNARSSEPTGSVRADTLMLYQKSGDFTAEGHVATSREPERKGKSSSNSAMLSTDAPMQASADRMTSSNEGKVVHYEGSAKAWQGANRVEGDRIDLDNQRGIMEAHGKVVTQIYDQKKSAGSSGLTKVQAPDLVYTRDTRVAHYTGGVALERPGAKPLNVNSRELTAFLSDSNSDSSLDRAVADGNVKIVSETAVPNSKTKRLRTATSEHAEYNAKDQQVILTGGRPLLVDSLKGRSQGEKVTFWINDDRVLVEGEERGPVKTTIKR